MRFTEKSMLGYLKIFLPITVGSLLIFGGLALAQQDTSPTVTSLEEVVLDETVQSSDLDISEPTLLPDNPFYFLKNWGRSIRLFFSFRPIDKAKLRLKFASEKLLEARKLAEKTKNPKIIKRAAENYQREIDKIKAVADKIKEKATENPEVGKFLDKFTKQQILHEKILEKLQEQVPEEVFEKIKEARERHIQRFGEVMQKLEENKERIRERIEENLQELKGSKFKDFKNLEILKKLEEKVPQEAKEAIQKARERILERLKEKIQQMTTTTQERLKRYIEKIQGDPERKFEILEDIKSTLKNQLQIRERLENAGEEIMRRIREKTQEREKEIGVKCPQWVPPAPGFCKEGRVVIEKDENGCPLPPKCIIPGEIGLPKAPATQPEKPVCISLWDPVCGIDGKTYSNACWAKVAGVEILHKGVCKETLPQRLQQRIQKFE